MIKILISVYIALILLIAGFADASIVDPNAAAYKFDRVETSPKVYLTIADARFDSRHEILTLSGNVSSECQTSLQPELLFDANLNQVLVAVTADGVNCLADANNHYEVVIDVKAFFAEQGLSQDSIVKFVIDNYVGGPRSFAYLAKQQAAYSFDTNATGTIVIDHRTQKTYLVGRGSKVEVVSRFDLRNFENRFVQVKGLIPTAVSIGEEVSPTTSQLLVGQLTALR